MDLAPIQPAASAGASERAAALWREVATFMQAPPSSAAGSAAKTDADPRSVVADPARQDVDAAPDTQLLRGTATTLQVEPGAGWGVLPQPAGDPLLAALTLRERIAGDDQRRQRPPTTDADDASDPADADAPSGSSAQPSGVRADSVVVETADADWCLELTTRLRQFAAAPTPPQALLALTEQWRRGRCALLACPQTLHAEANAWAFVLWPRAGGVDTSAGAPATIPALFGVRVAARLQWMTMVGGGAWWHMRLMRDHHRTYGRQLIAADAASGSGRVACQVKLGPMPGWVPRPCDVVVNVGAAHRLWAALGSQWSVQIVVSALPLLAPAYTVEAA